MSRERELKRVSQADRKKIALSTTLNRFWRRREENRAEAKLGPGCCRHCGSEPCGGGWGPLFGEHSARCCDHCSHAPIEGFRPTHVIWHRKKAFFVREVPMGRGGGAGSLYLRGDGVAWFMRIGESHYFLGRELQSVDFARFKVSDPNGWPVGMKGKDMGIGLNDEVSIEDDDAEDDDALGEDEDVDDEDTVEEDDDSEDDDSEDDDVEDDDAEDDDAEDDDSEDEDAEDDIEDEED